MGLDLDGNNEQNFPPMQRALVLQGGGAIAAYEAGVYSALYFLIKKDLDKDESLFDILAGTSGGAINAAIIVSAVSQNRKANPNSIRDAWTGTVKKLLDFWDHISAEPDLSNWWPFCRDKKMWLSTWEDRHNIQGKAARGEAARRYFSAKESLYAGSENVFSQDSIEHDSRFMDNSYPVVNIWHKYSNENLKKSIEKYTSFPIATALEERTPRLLMVSTDVEKGEAVTFDSYEKEDGSRKSEYGDYVRNGGKTRIFYKQGVMVEHVMASSSVPVHYDYAHVPLDYNYGGDRGTAAANQPGQYREFWDGGISSNTPLRELIQSHEDYWNNVKHAEQAIPALKVYMVDIWPHKGNLALDHDGVNNRLNDLRYQDKTAHEEKIAYLVLDLINLSKLLMKQSKISEADMAAILNANGESRHRDGTRRKYRDIIQHKVQIKEVIRIERNPDSSEISYKWCDYSSDTITLLIKQGVKETLCTMVGSRVQGKGNTNVRSDKQLDEFIEMVDAEKEKEQLDFSLKRILDGSNVADVLKKCALDIKREIQHG
jgi:NTE family protein